MADFDEMISQYYERR